MKNTTPTEHAEQVAFVQFLEREYPEEKFFAIPNGGHRNKIVAKKMRLEGQRKGVPDLYFPRLKFWLEMKRTKGGSLSPEQKEWRDYLISIGDKWEMAKGAAEAVKIFLRYVGGV